MKRLALPLAIAALTLGCNPGTAPTPGASGSPSASASPAGTASAAPSMAPSVAPSGAASQAPTGASAATSVMLKIDGVEIPVGTSLTRTASGTNGVIWALDEPGGITADGKYSVQCGITASRAIAPDLTAAEITMGSVVVTKGVAPGKLPHKWSKPGGTGFTYAITGGKVDFSYKGEATKAFGDEPLKVQVELTVTGLPL